VLTRPKAVGQGAAPMVQLVRQRLARNEHVDLVALQRAVASPDLTTSNEVDSPLHSLP
jgi:hypothetical protein